MSTQQVVISKCLLRSRFVSRGEPSSRYPPLADDAALFVYMNVIFARLVLDVGLCGKSIETWTYKILSYRFSMRIITAELKNRKDVYLPRICASAPENMQES